MGTFTPKLRSVSTMRGTAWAASSVFTVTRTSSEPARARSIIWFTVAAESAVSVLVMDCTTIGWGPPTLTPPMLTETDFRRGNAGIYLDNPPGTYSLPADAVNDSKYRPGSGEFPFIRTLDLCRPELHALNRSTS